MSVQEPRSSNPNLFNQSPMTEDTTLSKALPGLAEQLGYGQVLMKFDPETGMRAIIAIHNTTLGPALGGCRFIEYPCMGDAVVDALRLGRGMSFKAAMADLPVGGGKSVLIKPPHLKDRAAIFRAFGRFVNELNGDYITALDSGAELTDMDEVAKETKYVTSTSARDADPTPYTGDGLIKAMAAAIKFKLGKDSFQGVRIAIQGVGHVGHYVARHLAEQGAELWITDKDSAKVDEVAREVNAKKVGLDEIYAVDCDVFAPCALGAILNDKTIPLIKAKVICGAANNQLAEPRHDQIMLDRGILYTPDFVANAGGLIHVVCLYMDDGAHKGQAKIEGIYHTLMNIFERSKRENRPTGEIAEQMAQDKIRAHGAK